MALPAQEHPRLVAWNGIRVEVPAGWETRVGGHRQLLFEQEFKPLLQLRWEQAAKVGSKKLQRRLRGLFLPSDSIIAAEKLAPCWRRLGRSVAHLCCFGSSASDIRGGFVVCSHCGTLLLFHLSQENSPPAEMIADTLRGLSCHHPGGTLWQLQDFSLTTPPVFTLRSYTFAAGLTRLAFTTPGQQLETCRLAGADQRLALQPLPAILRILADAEDLEVTGDDQETCCEGTRHPTIFEQIRLRLRRVQPFIRAKIRHHRNTNRLLALVLSSKRPIPAADLATLDAAYETLPPENQKPANHQN